MRQQTLLALCFLAFSFLTARAASAQMAAGGGLAFGTEIKRPGLQGDFYVGTPNVTPGLSFGGDLTLFWPHHEETTVFGTTTKASVFLLSINANAQYVFYERTLSTGPHKKGRRSRRARAPTPVTGPQLALYGIGGLNLSYVRVSADVSGTSVTGSTTTDGKLKPGINLGAGVEYDLPFARLFGEFTYVISDFDQAVFVGGLRWDFGGPPVLES